MIYGIKAFAFRCGTYLGKVDCECAKNGREKVSKRHAVQKVGVKVAELFPAQVLP